MPQIKLHIRKQCVFGGQTRDFGNVYTLEGPTDDASTLDLMEKVVAAEKRIHAFGVTFVKANVWEDNAVMANHMIRDADLTGTGEVGTSGSLWRECAIMLHAPLAPSFAGSRRAKRSLRKFYKCLNEHGHDTGGTAIVGQPEPSSRLGLFLAELNNGFGTSYTLVGPAGDAPTGPWVSDGLLHSRQFGR